MVLNRDMFKFSWGLMVGVISMIGSVPLGYSQYSTDSTVLPSSKNLAIIDTVFVSFRAGEVAQKSAYTSFTLKNPINLSFHRTVPEALSEIPGIQVQKTNHGGGSPYLRGMTGNQILTIVDGIRLNNSTFRYGPNQYMNTVDGMAISAMDVALGTGSVQYGSDAIGGAILLQYRQAEFRKSKSFAIQKVGGITRLMAPSLEGSQRIYLDAANNKVALSVGITYRNFGDVIAGGAGIKQSPTGYTEMNANAKLRIGAKSGEWQIAAQHNRQHNVPVYHKIVLENFAINAMDVQGRELYYVRRIVRFGEKTQATFTTGIQGSLEHRTSQKNASFTSTLEQDKVHTKFLLAELNHRVLHHWLINSGVEIYSDNVLSTRTKLDLNSGIRTELRGLYPTNSKLNQRSIYAMAKGEWNNFQLTLGSRFQSTHSNIPDPTLGNVIDQNSALVNTIGISTSVINKKLMIADKFRFFANFSNSFRAPNIDDMGTLGIVDFRYELPQYNLKPEYSNNHEVGIKWAGDRLKFQVSVYQNYLYNVIARVRLGKDSLNGYPLYQKENIERAIIQGVECYSEISLGQRMFVKAGYCTMKGDNLTKMEPMRRIPPSHGLVQWNYLWGNRKENKIFIRYVAAASQRRLAAGDKSDNRIGIQGTPGYLQLDIGCQFLWKDFRIATSMQNISNEYVKVHGSGVAMPGRSISLVIEF